MTQVDTARAAKRTLRFQSIDALRDEVDRLVAAEREGGLRTLGNWSAGQIFSHLAAWIEYAYEGFPVASPPFFIRWAMRLMKKRFLQRGLPSGVRIPRVPGGTTGMDPAETAVAAERYHRALRRLESDEKAEHESPAFGPLTHEERIQLNLRHAELHLGFLQPAS